MLEKLESIHSLAEASKFQRLFFAPGKYIWAFIFRKLIYPFGKKGQLKSCKTFFDSEMQVLLPAGTDIYLLGAKSHLSEIKLAKFICKNLSENDVFVDVGVHFGYYTLLSSKLVGDAGKVLSIEASPEIFKVLKRNAAPFKNIEAINKACSNQSEKITFYEFPILYSEYNTLSPEQFEKVDWIQQNPAKEVEIQATSLDAICQEKKLIPSMVKIDVEGAEDKVVEGMQNLLKKASIKSIALEFLNDDRQNSAHISAANLLVENGYLPHVLYNDGNAQLIQLSQIKSYFEQNRLDSDNIIFQKATQ